MQLIVVSRTSLDFFTEWRLLCKDCWCRCMDFDRIWFQIESLTRCWEVLCFIVGLFLLVSVQSFSTSFSPTYSYLLFYHNKFPGCFLPPTLLKQEKKKYGMFIFPILWKMEILAWFPKFWVLCLLQVFVLPGTISMPQGWTHLCLVTDTSSPKIIENCTNQEHPKVKLEFNSIFLLSKSSAGTLEDYVPWSIEIVIWQEATMIVIWKVNGKVYSYNPRHLHIRPCSCITMNCLVSTTMIFHWSHNFFCNFFLWLL